VWALGRHRRSQEFVLGGGADNRDAEGVEGHEYGERTEKRVLEYLELEKTHLIATNLS